MLGLDDTQISTLSEGWQCETEDTEAAVMIAEAMGVDLINLVSHVDQVISEVTQHGLQADDPRRLSPSYIMWVTARMAAGLEV